MLRAAVTALALAVASATAAAPANGQPTAEDSRKMQMRATYHVAAGCMSAGAFLRKLSQHFDMGGANGLDLFVVVHRDPETAIYAVTMSFNGSQPVRLKHARCDKLLEDAVMEAGISRTRLPMAQAVEHIDRLQIALARDSKQHHAEVNPLEANRTSDPWLLGERLPEYEEDNASTPDEPPDEPHLAPPIDPLVRQQFVLGTHLGAGAGILPKQSTGVGLTALLTAWSAQLRLDATWWMPQSWTPVPTDHIPYSRVNPSQLAVQTLALGACWPVAGLATGVQLRACLQGVGNRISTNGSSFGAASRFNVGVRSRLGIAWAFDVYQVELIGSLDGLTRGATIRLQDSAPGQDSAARSGATPFSMDANVATLGITFGGAIPLSFLRPDHGL